MGSFLKATCPCGYQKDGLEAGGGWFYKCVLTFCGFPALCPACNLLLDPNFLDPDAHCPDCSGPIIYYSDPDLMPSGALDQPEENDIFTCALPEPGKAIRLPDVGYYCPGCGGMSLRFVCEALFD